MENENLKKSFSVIMNECYHTWNWELDSLFNVVHSDCPCESIFKTILIQSGHREGIEDHLGRSNLPVICMLPNRLSWIVAFEERSEHHCTIHIKGPIFIGHAGMERFPEFWELFSIPPETRPLIEKALKDLPVMPHTVVMELAVILHYCLNRERIQANDVVYGERIIPGTLVKNVNTNQFDKGSGRYELEQEMLTKVRNGDMSILETMNAFSELPNAVRYSDLESYKLGVHQLITLVSRTAVEGGLAQKTSFSLCTYYRQKVKSAKSMEELGRVRGELLSDYVLRIRRLKKYDCSSQIRLCCEYIDTHPEETISLDTLAQKSGYTRTYLSRKFNQEMNCSITEYIQRSKIERAKYLLVNTDSVLEDISDVLGFSSRNYFSSVFKKQVGISPQDYRKKKGVV